jgi:thiol-disulfide isomerase/thioredoxin
MKFSLLLILIAKTTRLAVFAAVATSSSQQTQSSTSSPPVVDGNKDVFRYNNLDYIDTKTLQYYLDAPSENFDVAVLYFAQWCKNCHALAP